VEGVTGGIYNRWEERGLEAASLTGRNQKNVEKLHNIYNRKHTEVEPLRRWGEFPIPSFHS
jgi:hypothetical protein